MAKVFLNTNPFPGDLDNVLLGKILQQLGGTPELGDTDANLLRKILIQWGGTFFPGDSGHRLLYKILATRGGIPKPGDGVHRLLWKILEQLGGVPAPGDSVNNLLVKILERLAGSPEPVPVLTATVAGFEWTWSGAEDPPKWFLQRDDGVGGWIPEMDDVGSIRSYEMPPLSEAGLFRLVGTDVSGFVFVTDPSNTVAWPP